MTPQMRQVRKCEPQTITERKRRLKSLRREGARTGRDGKTYSESKRRKTSDRRPRTRRPEVRLGAEFQPGVRRRGPHPDAIVKAYSEEKDGPMFAKIAPLMGDLAREFKAWQSQLLKVKG